MSSKDKVKQGILQKFGLEVEEGAEDPSSSSDTHFLQALQVMKRVLNDGTPSVVSFLGEDYMCISSVGAAYHLPSLLSHRVSHVLCLSRICKAKFPDMFKYKKVSCQDSADQDLTPVLEECFHFINEFKSNREQDKRILIHCYQGISRAPTVCAAYMIKYYGFSLEESLHIIQKHRPQASPNYHFMKTLKALEEETDRERHGS